MGDQFDCDADRCDRTDYHTHELDDHSCPVEDCAKAYPHPLLREGHLVKQHPSYLEPAEPSAQ